MTSATTRKAMLATCRNTMDKITLTILATTSISTESVTTGLLTIKTPITDPTIERTNISTRKAERTAMKGGTLPPSDLKAEIESKELNPEKSLQWPRTTTERFKESAALTVIFLNNLTEKEKLVLRRWKPKIITLQTRMVV
jgi:hypothetical protein